VDECVACFQYAMLATVIAFGDGEMTYVANSLRRLFWG
jgi:hypothetical protein